jgi:hypothetical protein
MFLRRTPQFFCPRPAEARDMLSALGKAKLAKSALLMPS